MVFRIPIVFSDCDNEVIDTVSCIFIMFEIAAVTSINHHNFPTTIIVL